MEPDRVTIEKSRIILCEGPSDVSFLSALHKAYDLPEAQIICPQGIIRHLGRDGIPKLLIGVRAWSGFAMVKEIIIVVDSDENSTRTFNSLVKDIPSDYHKPSDPLIKSSGSPSITILLLPWPNEEGSLESLCYRAASAIFPSQSECVVKLTECAEISGWKPQKQAKSKLRSLISVIHERAPDLPLSEVWRQAPDLIPIKSQEFERVLKFFREL